MINKNYRDERYFQKELSIFSPGWCKPFVARPGNSAGPTGYYRIKSYKPCDDALRRSHAVQYISMPLHDWEKLRTEFPGKYENSIKQAPSPDDWFHVKIVVDGKKVTVFVNNEIQPLLEVDKLSTNNKGGIALWMGNNSGGSFANLKITRAS